MGSILAKVPGYALLAGAFFTSACGSRPSGASLDAMPMDPGPVDGGMPDPIDGSLGGLDAGTILDASISPDADESWELNDAGLPLCENKEGPIAVCQCADGTDNEATPDGLIDYLDPECSGPFDNDESSYSTGIPGDNSDPYAQDCFFDGDSGGGNDGCRWDIRCTDMTAPYEGTHCNNNTTDGCDTCKTMTPNGCDCFGCCEVYVDGVPHRVRIIDSCTAENVDDPLLCPPCEFVEDCTNPCDPCVEECLGEVPDPSTNPDCASVPDAGTTGGCSPGVLPCDPYDNSCAPGTACVTGCCQSIIQ